jgi:hypothetical protein
VTGKLPDDHGSISFWVRPDGTTDRASLAQLRSRYVYENRLQLWQDKGSIRLVFADSTGTESNLSYESDSWEPGEWRMVTVTWGDGQNALYINGDLAGASQYDGNFKILPDTLLHVASNYVEDSPSLEGSVNRFHVYDRPLTPEEVAAELSNYPE